MITVSAIRNQNKSYLNDMIATDKGTSTVDVRNAKSFYEEAKKKQDATSGYKPNYQPLNVKQGNQTLTSTALRNQYKDILTANSETNQLSIKLNEKDDEIAKFLQARKKALENPLMITLKPNFNFEAKLASLITNEDDYTNTNPQVNKDRAYKNLTQITDKKTVIEYILERLTPEEIFYFNKNFPQIRSNLEKKHAYLNKDEFINFLRQFIREHQPRLTENLKRDDDNSTSGFESINNDVFEEEKTVNIPKYYIPAGEDEPTLSQLTNPTENFNERVFEILRKQPTDINNDEAEYLYRHASFDLLQPRYMRRILDFLNIPYKQNRDRRYYLRLFETYQSKVGNEEGQVKEGYGMKRKPRSVIIKQSAIPKQQEYIAVFDGNFLINAIDLRNGILNVKSKTKKPLRHLTKEPMTKELRELVEDTIDGKYDFDKFMKLSTQERRIFKRFNTALKLGLETNDDAHGEFNKRYEILIGELQNGNNSPQLKREIKYYLIEALKAGMITKNQMLEELVLLNI